MTGRTTRLIATLLSFSARALADDPSDAFRAAVSGKIDDSAIAVPTEEAPIAAAAVFERVDGLGAGAYLRGRSRLPEGALLHVVLTFHERQVETRRATVGAGGAYEVVLGPYPDRLVFQGVYAFEVQYHPHRQPSRLRGAPGLPADARDATASARFGSAEGEAEELESRRTVYVQLAALLVALDAELQREAKAAGAREKYVLGERKDLDEYAWREWVGGWRERLDRDVSEPLRRHRDREVLALNRPAEFQLVLTLVAYYQQLVRVESQDLYQALGRPVHAEDRIEEGGAILNRGAIRSQIQKYAAELERLLVKGESR